MNDEVLFLLRINVLSQKLVEECLKDQDPAMMRVNIAMSLGELEGLISGRVKALGLLSPDAHQEDTQ